MEDAPRTPEPSAGGTDAPVGLGQFYGQQLAWSGCQDFVVAEYQEGPFASSRVQCARLTVPLDYQNTGPGAPTVTLGVLRAPAARPDQRIGTAVVLPTEDGLGMDLATYVSGNGDEFSNRFDVVSFDRRGVGASAPAIECLSAADVDRARASTTRTRNDTEVAAADAETAEFAAACLRNSAAGSGLDPAEFLAHAGSREAVQDVEVLRAVLGAPTLSVLGYGYGARTALAYATGHPDRVRAMVLDSPGSPPSPRRRRWPGRRRLSPRSTSSPSGAPPVKPARWATIPVPPRRPTVRSSHRCSTTRCRCWATRPRP